jgi:hypothetical protein
MKGHLGDIMHVTRSGNFWHARFRMIWLANSTPSPITCNCGSSWPECKPSLLQPLTGFGNGPWHSVSTRVSVWNNSQHPIIKKPVPQYTVTPLNLILGGYEREKLECHAPVPVPTSISSRRQALKVRALRKLLCLWTGWCAMQIENDRQLF